MISLLLFGSAWCGAQLNYVFNPSFEEHIQCPIKFGQIQRASGWWAATAGTSDYLLNCEVVGSQVDVPISYMGIQNARTGDGYAGIIIYSDNSVFDYKEYIQSELKHPLIEGMPYKLSFYASVADYVSTYVSEDLGVVISPAAAGYDYQLGTITNLAPPITSDGFISTTTDWVKVEGTYEAIGGEQYITIGSFKKSSQMELQYVNPNGEGFAYYFIDDVRVEIDFTSPLFGDVYGNGYDPSSPGDNAYYDDGCLYDVIIPNIFTPSGDGINDEFFIQYTGYIKSDIIIADRWGSLVFSAENFMTGSWDAEGQSHGVYFYALNMMKQDGTYDTFTGSIQVIGH